MAKRSEPPLIEPLSDSEFGELDDLLLSDDLPEACMVAVTLEGFLTAIAIGPVTVTPEQWLPQVFGGNSEDPMPAFPSSKIFERVVNLIMRFYNSVLMIFEIGPEKFSPTFYIHEVEGKTYTIVDEWCSDFLQGIALAGDAWQPLLDEKPDILRPFQLFATPEGWAELDEAALHAEWSSKIEPTVHSIHAYWLPYREGYGKLWLRPIPRERQESQRWGAIRLAPVGAERNTNIAVVPDVHCIDPTVGNA